MNVSGFPAIYPILMSMTIFAGSIEFVAVNLLLGSFNPLNALFLAIMVNARHLFYGISMLEKYKDTGIKKNSTTALLSASAPQYFALCCLAVRSSCCQP